VPLRHGRFGLDEYTEHLMNFLAAMGPGAHVLSICQPCVATLAAVSLMSEDDHPATPRSMTLMAGPIDCRIQPTAVNKLATSKPIEWFEQNLIATVPFRYPGGGRRVYPGFVQLSAFMSMNMDRHVQALRGMVDLLANGEVEKAQATRAFYEEYFAVADLPAEFYLETVQCIFQDYLLPRGQLRFRGRPVNPASIRRTALLTVEGERDDICAIGQTLAAHDMCPNIKPFMKSHYVQAGAGHYGVFSGKRWANQIYPLMRDTVHMMA
jgi:poly(3-hydroxybutyrate) depolymerase